ALDGEHRLWPASAAVRPSGDGIGQDRHYLHAAVADLIAPRGHDHHELRRNRADGVRVGAQVGDHVHLEAEHRAVSGERQLRGHDLVAALIRGEELLATRSDPLDWATDPQRQVAGERFFAVERAFTPQAPANIGGDHAKTMLRHANRGGEICTRTVWTLG